MSAFDGIDRSTVCGFSIGPQPPLTIELIREGFARMLVWRPPPPMPVQVNDEFGVIIWSVYHEQIRDLRARGVTGEAMARQLALTTPLGYMTALGFVAWLETVVERCKVHDEPALAKLLAECPVRRVAPQPTGMCRARDERVKPTPPVPPWARARKHRR